MLEQKDLDRIEALFQKGLNEVQDKLEKELCGVRAELKEEIQGVRSELKEELQGVQSDLRAELKEELQGVQSNLRIELKEEIRGVRAELSAVSENVKEQREVLNIVIAHQEVMENNWKQMKETIETLQSFYRIAKIENSNVDLILKMVIDLQERMAKLEKTA